MRRVPLGDHRIAGSHGGGKISTRCAVEGEGKIVRAEDDHWADRRKHRADVGLGIDRGLHPRAVARRGSRLPQLIDRSRQLDRFQTGLDRQRRFGVGHRNQLFRASFEPAGKGVEKGGKPFAGPAADAPSGGRRSLQGPLDLAPRTDRIIARECLTRLRINGLKRFPPLRLGPSPVDQHFFGVHRCLPAGLGSLLD